MFALPNSQNSIEIYQPSKEYEKNHHVYSQTTRRGKQGWKKEKHGEWLAIIRITQDDYKKKINFKMPLEE